MERRDFMTSVGSLMALGTLSTPLVGHATTGGLTPGDLSEEGLDAYMDEVSAQIRRIEATRVDPEIKRHLRQRGMPARLTKDIARAMLVSSAVRDLPPELQEHAKVQRRLRREAPRVTRTMMRLTDFLKGHSEEEHKEIQQHLRENPDLAEETISHYTRWCDRHGLPPERREQTRSLMESTSWQLTHQPPSTVVSECTDKVDRMCTSAGFRQENWEAYLSVEQKSFESDQAGSGAVERLTQPKWSDSSEVYFRGAFEQLAIGGGVLVLGLAMFGYGTSSGAYALFLPGGIATMLGGAMVFLGLLYLLTAMVKSFNE